MSRFCNVKPLVLVIGDSHLFWLKQFVASSDVRFCPGTSVFEARDCRVKAKLWEISSDTHQLQLIKLHHFKLEIFKSI